MKTILFVHQAAELYGSDRTLLVLIQGLDPNEYRSVVVLPAGGPLVRELEAAGARVHVLPLARIERASLSPAGLAGLPLQALTSARALDRALRVEQIDLVYTNTLAVLTGVVWAGWRRKPHLWHVHELIERPRIARWTFGNLLQRSSRVVFNSHATQACYQRDFSALGQNSEVVFSGIDRPRDRPTSAPAARAALRRDWGADDATLVVCLVGRISRWKGQMLLIDAAERLGVDGPRIVFVFAGSAPPGQEHLSTALDERIARSPIRGSLRSLGFSDPWPILDASDVAVVPSIEPEPFGLVAVEAMLAERPVIAAAHGGLAEIVEDGVTGRHVRPGDAAALASAIAELAGDPELRQRFGSAGRARAEQFSGKRYVEALVRTLGGMLGSRKALERS